MKRVLTERDLIICGYLDGFKAYRPNLTVEACAAATVQRIFTYWRRQSPIRQRCYELGFGLGWDKAATAQPGNVVDLPRNPA